MSHKAYTTFAPGKQKREPKQSTKLEGQVKNSDGCYVYSVDDRTRLDRFLILGSSSGSYYSSEKKLTKDNAKAIIGLIKQDGVYVVNRIVEISDSGRAPKNDPALFVWALCVAYGNDETRKSAYDSLSRVARIGTHLFHAVDFIENLKENPWSRGLRTAVSRWYNEKDADNLSFLVGKYMQRDGWSNNDLIRLAHPTPMTEKHSLLFKWLCVPEKIENKVLKDNLPKIWALEELKKADDAKVLTLIDEYKLPIEFIPTEKRSKKVYEKMLNNFGLTALIRNLGKLSELEILKQGSYDEVNRVCERITDLEAIKKSRVHPFSILLALTTYSGGRGFRGKLAWTPVQKVVDALDEAFYLAFKVIEPTGLRYTLALDVSGSMDGSMLNGTNMSARVGSSAMAMTVSKVEKNYSVMAFSSGYIDLEISPKMRLDDICKKTERLPFDSTDCSLPMRWAMDRKVPTDVFVIYTDSETNHSMSVQPHVALKQYRDKMGINAKMIVVGMTATEFTIADPEDSGSLDLIGFDSDAPQIIREFSLGNI